MGANLVQSPVPRNLLEEYLPRTNFFKLDGNTRRVLS